MTQPEERARQMYQGEGSKKPRANVSFSGGRFDPIRLYADGRWIELSRLQAFRLLDELYEIMRTQRDG